MSKQKEKQLKSVEIENYLVTAALTISIFMAL
jgi:hypothetical protein